MKNQIKSLFFIITSLLVLTGCATTPEVPMSDSFWHNQGHKVAVVMAKPPKPRMSETGQQGLLDLAIVEMGNHGINKYLAQQDMSWYNKMQNKFVDKLKQKSFNAYAVATQIDAEDKKSILLLREKHRDRILSIKLNGLGAVRSYFSFIPTGRPKAYCSLLGELRDSKTDQVLWRHQAIAEIPIQGKFQQAPNYPNLTEALKHSIDLASQELVDNFFSGR